MRELWLSVLHTSGAKVYSLATGILLLFVTARLLGPDGRGQVAAVTTCVGLFTTFGCLSLGQVALHRMATDPDHGRFGPLVATLASLALTISLLGWVVALGLYVSRPELLFKGLPRNILVLGFIGLPFLIWEQYGSSLLAGLERIGVYNRYQILGRTVAVVLTIALMYIGHRGVAGVLEGNLAGQVIVAMGGAGLLTRYAHKKSSPLKPQSEELIALLKGGVKLHLNAIGAFLTTSVNVLILNHYQEAADVGSFQLASQLISVLMVVPQSAAIVMFGKVANLGPDTAWPQNRRLLFQLSVLMLALSAGAALCAPIVLPMLAGRSFESAVKPFQYMLFGVVGLTFSSVMAPQWIGRGYFLQAAALTFAVGSVNLGANLWLIPRYGIDGAVMAFVGTYFFSVLANGLMAWHCELQYQRSRVLLPVS